MKYLKINLVILTILISHASLPAQTNKLSINQIGSHIGNGIYHNYHPDSIEVSKLCRRACVFIKFKVDQKGHIVDLDFSKDSISFIKEALTKAVYSLQKDSELMEAVKKANKTIILPVLYYYQAGCNFPTSQPTEASKEETNGDKRKESYLSIYADSEFFGATIWDMLNFNKGKLEVIDCLLLGPSRVGAGSLE
ncbi:hypothetical protein AB6735_20790 [Mucilaginibacter sp. RCC_168]|uniref:hypothetical protein n=1 Tax=Mucilaginibacter sp. RCC_168 TaxID=3239221 RepID=UPI003523A5BB